MSNQSRNVGRTSQIEMSGSHLRESAAASRRGGRFVLQLLLLRPLKPRCEMTVRWRVLRGVRTGQRRDRVQLAGRRALSERCVERSLLALGHSLFRKRLHVVGDLHLADAFERRGKVLVVCDILLSNAAPLAELRCGKLESAVHDLHRPVFEFMDLNDLPS